MFLEGVGFLLIYDKMDIRSTLPEKDSDECLPWYARLDTLDDPNLAWKLVREKVQTDFLNKTAKAEFVVAPEFMVVPDLKGTVQQLRNHLRRSSIKCIN